MGVAPFAAYSHKLVAVFLQLLLALGEGLVA